MKLYFDFGRLDGWKHGAGSLCLILALAAGGGCGKSQKTPSPSDSTSTAAAPTTAPAMTPPAAPIPSSIPPISPGAAGPTQVQSLNRALLGWKMNNHRRPQTFEEFASTAGFQIPNPPAGKKYALSSKGFIVLVNSNQ